MGGKVVMFTLSLQLRIFTLLQGKYGTWSLKCSNPRFSYSHGTPLSAPTVYPPGDSLCPSVAKLCFFLKYRQVKRPERALGAEDLATGLGRAPPSSGPQLPHLLQKGLWVCCFQGPFWPGQPLHPSLSCSCVFIGPSGAKAVFTVR